MITLNVNGREHQVDADGSTPLLYVLRDDLGLNGAKFGCGLGQCGACTVLVDDKPVFSCVAPIVALLGRGAMIVRISLLQALAAQEQTAVKSQSTPPLPGSLMTSPMLDSWIRIDADGITVFTGKAELGQGIKTALIQVAAEELSVELHAIN